MSIDTLINNAELRANSYASATDTLVAELRSFINSGSYTVNLPDGGLDIESLNFPEYESPEQDQVAMPVYEPPTAELPDAPELTDIGSIELPERRTAPTLNTSGLFDYAMPSLNLPEFNEAEPDMRIDDLVSEMDNLVTPVLQTIDMPTITPFSLGDAPTLTLPEYDAPSVPDDLDKPEDYSAKMETVYQQMLPEMQAFVDDKVATWIATYAPEYQAWSLSLQDKVTDGMDGTVLPDQIESAMFTRARGRIENEFNAAEQGLLESYSKSGFMQPPGALMSGLHHGRLKSAEALANQATDIYIERRKMEVQHLQFVMGLASSQIQSVRNIAISYAGVVLNSMQQAVGYASEIADKLGKVFDHLIARAQLKISILNVINAQYEVKLKAALSALDGYRLELDAEKAKKDVELSQIQLVEAQIKTQELEIQRYSAMIEAVTRKSSVEELKLKGYNIRADIFKTRTHAKLSEFDVYKSALEGDQAKLDGELSKLKIFESELRADGLRLDAQVKAVQATTEANNAKVDIFKAGGDVYKLDAEAALQKFTAYSEVKKLAQSIYGQELVNAIESFKADFDSKRTLAEFLIKEREIELQKAVKEAELKLQRLQLSERASEQSVDAYRSMASSALGSLNTMASSAISESS